ncbi:MAG TPA: hypothetical protein VGR37_24105 [Longimicrobiaceae bacterium]|nr:hypothetical protein [Longimicrobiaceae bacterium]
MTSEPVPLRLPRADPAYRLDGADRAKMLPGFDADALERLLAMVRPDRRREVLAHFQKREDGERARHLVALDDPELQGMLEEVWAPVWDAVQATDAELAADVYGFPGREIAMQRRAARAQVQRDGAA